MANIIFCESGLARNKVDEAFVCEYESARENGFTVFLYNYEEMSSAKTKPSEKREEIIYRGWILKPYQYKKLYDDLLSKNYVLINNPAEYQNCHYFPDSLRFISSYTPKTIFQKIKSENDEESINALIEKAKVFCGKPVIIKDFVKSEKHYWDSACFVEDSSNTEKLRETIHNFMELRGDAFNEGIVIREYVKLNVLTNHSKSGIPLSEEYRLFFFRKKLLSVYNYWEEGNYNAQKPDTNEFEKLAQNIENNFFTMDIAKNTDGNYIIIELGDAQVSGIPEKEDKNMFYKKLTH